MGLKKLLIMMILSTAILTPTAKLQAFEYSTDLGGCGYQECRAAPRLAPAIALAAVALAGVLVLALQTQSGHSHSE